MALRLRPGVLPHFVTLAWLCVLAWFVGQPIGGDVAIWGPSFAGAFAVAAGFVLNGLIVWQRWGSWGSLALADVVGIGPVALFSLAYGPFAPIIALPLAVPAIFGLLRARDGPGLLPLAPLPTRRRVMLGLVAGIPAVVFGWLAVTEGLGIGGFGFGDGAIVDAAVAVATGVAVVAWLADRPGPLLGTGLAFIWWAAPAVMIDWSHLASDSVMQLLAMGLCAPLAVALAGRDLLARGQRRNARLGVFAAVAAVAAQVAMMWFDPRLLVVAPLASFLGPPLPGGGAEEGTTLARLVPNRLVTWAGIAVLACLGLVFLTMLNEPWTGDVGPGPAGFALLTVAPAATVYALVLAVWAGARRPTPLLLATAVAAWIGLGVLMQVESASAFLPMALTPIAALVIAIGAAEVLRNHRIERVVAIVALCGFALAGWLVIDTIALFVGLGMAACIAGERAWSLALAE